METISPSRKDMPQGLVGGAKFGLTWSVLGREGPEWSGVKKDFHAREGNFKGTSFRLIERGLFLQVGPGPCLQQRRCSSLAEKSHHRPFYHQSFHRATAKDLWNQEGGCSDPRDIWRTNRNMFGTLGRRKACCKGTGWLSWSNSDYDTSPRKAPGYNYIVCGLVKPHLQRRAQRGGSRREFPLSCCWGRMSAVVCFVAEATPTSYYMNH